MVAMFDSAAVFQERAREMGVTEPELETMKAKNQVSFADLAFACSYRPVQADEVRLLKFASMITGAGAQDPT